MLLFRWLFMMLLLTAVVLFALYAGTGKAQYRKAGLVIVKWTIIAGLGFFAVLILERIA